MADKPFWEDSVAAADGASAPVERKADAQAGSLEAGAGASKAQTTRSTQLLPSDIRAGEADATVKEIKADKAKAEATRAETNRRMAALRGQEDTLQILRNIQQARSNIGPTSTGLPGQGLQHFWGTKARDLHASLNAIMGPGVIDKLQELKNQSASGASGFGALSQKELELIQNSIAAIGQDQSDEQLQENLNSLEEHYRRFQAYNAGLDPDQPEVAHAAGLMPSAEANDEKGKVTNEGKWEYNPTYKGLNATVTEMIKRGRTADEIRAYADTIEKGLGARLQGLEAGIDYWKDSDEKRRGQGVPPNIDVERYYVPQTDETKKEIGAAMNSAPGAFAAGSVDAYTSGTADEMSTLGGANRAGTEALFRGMEEEHPTAYTLGNMAGSLAQYASLRGLAGKYLGPGATEAFQNASYGAGSAQPGDRIAGAGMGAASGFVGDKAVKGLVQIPGTVLGGSASPHVNTLTDAKIPLTTGQAVGGQFKNLEDRLLNVPIVGPQIKNRRREASEGFNIAAGDEALSSIGGKWREVGEAGVEDAHRQVSAAYGRALSGTRLQEDAAFLAAFGPGGTVRTKLANIHDVGPALEAQLDIILAKTKDPTTGLISGDAFQIARREVDTLLKDYKRNEQFNVRIGPAIQEAKDELDGLFTRQYPDRAAEYLAANKANRHVSIIEDAVLGSGAASDGVFTPGQLRQKSIANTKIYGSKRQAAEGKRPFYELDRAGRQVLPSTMPDSGTTGHAIGAGLLGSAVTGVGGMFNAATAGENESADFGTPILAGGVLAALAGGPYSRRGQKIGRTLFGSNMPPQIKSIGQLTNEYVAPAAAAMTRPLYSDMYVDRTPSPKVPFKPAGVPAGAPPEAEKPAGPVIPPGAIVDVEKNEIVLPDGTRMPLEEAGSIGMAYGGAVRRLARKYACGGPVRRYADGGAVRRLAARYGCGS